MNPTTANVPRIGRRALLGGVATAAVLAPLAALATRSRHAAPAERDVHRAFSADYGPLVPVRDHTTGLPVLCLPRGFEYISYGWSGDPMGDGTATPTAHDGMAAFRLNGDRRGRISLVRNHEVGGSVGRFTDPAYDPDSGGGTTTVVFNPNEARFLDSYGSISGTERNCAGGATPWGTWLTCEESLDANPRTGRRHGYVFEVPRTGTGDPTPLRAMGRFVHEAVAVDPTTGYVYETEDAAPAGLFRFRPTIPAGSRRAACWRC